MNSDIRDWEYRHYVANCLNVTACGQRFTEIQPSLYEVMHPAPVDNRSVEEITQEVLKRTGITLKE